MPTNRTFRGRIPQIEFDYAMLTHMQNGSCFLAGPGLGCGCGLVDQGGALNEALVERLWREHRAEILSAWKDHPGDPWCASQ